MGEKVNANFGSWWLKYYHLGIYNFLWGTFLGVLNIAWPGTPRLLNLSPLPLPTLRPVPAAFTLAQAYGVESDLSEVARRGSGSACRSLYGGFVEWQMGERADGKDSIAQQVAPELHWPELRVLILVVSDTAAE